MGQLDDDACKNKSKPTGNEVPTLRPGEKADTCDRTRYAAPANGDLDPVELYKMGVESIFAVQATSNRSLPAELRDLDINYGSGFAFAFDSNSNSCYIVTADHTVKNMDKVILQRKDGVTVKTEVDYRDEASDLAVLKVSAFDINCKPLRIARSFQDNKFAVMGFPFDQSTLFFSRSDGKIRIITAARAREIGVATELLEFDAHVEKGNSGSAIVAPNGDVVGVAVSRKGEYKVFGVAATLLQRWRDSYASGLRP